MGRNLGKNYCNNCCKSKFGSRVKVGINIKLKFNEMPNNTSLTGFRCRKCNLNYIAKINSQLKVRYYGSYVWENYIFE